MTRQYGMWNKAAYDTSGFDGGDDCLSWDEVYEQVEAERRAAWEAEAPDLKFIPNGAKIAEETKRRLEKMS